METDLAADWRSSLPEGVFRVALLGDSTHYYNLPPSKYMIEALRRRLKGVEVVGFHNWGMDAFDHYLVLRRLMEEKPDLIVVPINLRFLGEGFAHFKRDVHAPLLAYVPVRDYPKVIALSSEHREFRWERMFLQRLDYRLFGHNVTPFIRGIRSRYKDFEGDVISRAEELTVRLWVPMPGAPSAANKGDLNWIYPQQLDGTHYMLQQFREMSRYAHENDVSVLYYAVQTRAPFRSRQKANFLSIERQLRRDEGAHFTDLGFPLEHDQFHDSEHLTPEGVEVVATRLSADILKLRETMLSRRRD